jgi:hypothetical protein
MDWLIAYGNLTDKALASISGACKSHRIAQCPLVKEKNIAKGHQYNSVNCGESEKLHKGRQILKGERGL